MVSFRGQNLLHPRPDWSPLEVKFKISDEHPRLFRMGVPPPPGAKGHEDSIVVDGLGLRRIVRSYKYGKLYKKIRRFIVICIIDHELHYYTQLCLSFNYILPLGCNNFTTCHGMAYI